MYGLQEIFLQPIRFNLFSTSYLNFTHKNDKPIRL